MSTSVSDCNKYPSAAAYFKVSNVDILTQILSRLPVKSLLVLKSVSKQWFSLISDPFFIHKHNLQNSPLSIQGLYTQSWRWSAVKKLDYIPLNGSSPSSAPFKTFSFINDPFGIKIEQSCNGHMLCRSCCNTHDYPNEYPTYYICNPSTRLYRPIVCESQKHVKGFEKLSCVSLAYDPLKSPHYKVVCIWLVSRVCSSNYQIQIYSSETASWKMSGKVFSRPGRHYLGSGVFWNGSLHWTDTFSVGSLFYYNVDRELRMKMKMPVYDKEPEMEAKNFVECNGHLYLIVSRVTRVYSPTSFQILEMKTDYTGWSVRYHVNLQELILAYPRSEFDVLHVKEAEGVSPKLVLGVLDRVISYDLHDMSFKEIQQLALAPGDRESVAYQYIQTLAWV